jgi:Arc/MetJ-type ribon-helix-helix transcriptional regulator
MIRQYSEAVHRLIRERMASGKYASEEELLRQAFEALDSQDEEDRAIQVGLDSLDAGNPGTPLEEAFERIRNKYNISG